MASREEQPKESDLVLVASLSGEDVQAVDLAILREVNGAWAEARIVVQGAHSSLQSTHPSVPDVFFSYRLRKLVAAGSVEARGSVDRQLSYQVRDASHAPAP